MDLLCNKIDYRRDDVTHRNDIVFLFYHKHKNECKGLNFEES